MADFGEKQALEALKDMLQCNAECGGNFETKQFSYEEDLIEYLYKNLPTAPYVLDRIVNFIFSNGLTTGDEDEDEKLDAFLYAKNAKGATNYSVLREAVKNALIYGKSGIRWLSEEAGILSVNSKNYASLVDDNEEFYGFEDTIAYIIAADEKEKIWKTTTKELDFDKELFIKKGIVYDKDRKILIVSKEEFVNLRTNTMKENGESKLAFDTQRLRLLTTIYERLNYDLEYDGPGRLLFRLSDNYAKGDENELGTTEVLNQTKEARDSRLKKAKAEVAALGEQIKNSKSDSVILLSNIFDDFDHLERVTKATEFLDYLDNEGVILSQVFGINPALIGLGKISGNVSMEKIIDNAMLNDIIPLREHFAIQFSSVIAEKIGVSKIYFDKYEMQQVSDDNDKRLKIVNMIEKLVKSGYQTLADKMAKTLEDDLDENNGKLKNLKTTIFTRMKKLFTRRDD